MGQVPCPISRPENVNEGRAASMARPFFIDLSVAFASLLAAAWALDCRSANLDCFSNRRKLEPFDGFGVNDRPLG